MTPANVFKGSLLFFVAWEILLLFVEMPEPFPMGVGFVIGMVIGTSGFAAYQERHDRIERDRWNRTWR
jgi:hypothetical protein